MSETRQLAALQIVSRAQDACDALETEGVWEHDEAASLKRDLSMLLEFVRITPPVPAPPASSGTPEPSLRCDHCGCAVRLEDDCPKCGAVTPLIDADVLECVKALAKLRSARGMDKRIADAFLALRAALAAAEQERDEAQMLIQASVAVAVDGMRAQLASQQEALAEARKENRELRGEWCLAHCIAVHGTSAAMYGDDGCRDCNACGIDFANTPVETIQMQLFARAQQRAAALTRSAPPEGETT